jgi:hypothetical protein
LQVIGCVDVQSVGALLAVLIGRHACCFRTMSSLLHQLGWWSKTR